jgi:hypothetical protein
VISFLDQHDQTQVEKHVIAGFLGDVHGHVFHALGVLARWQKETGTPFDLIVQVGDLGVWPDPIHADEATLRFGRSDPGKFDFCRLLHLDGQAANSLREPRQRFRTPILFIRGNHEDQTWLDSKQIVNPGSLGALDTDAGTLHFVHDNWLAEFGRETDVFSLGQEPRKES